VDSASASLISFYEGLGGMLEANQAVAASGPPPSRRFRAPSGPRTALDTPAPRWL